MTMLTSNGKVLKVGGFSTSFKTADRMLSELDIVDSNGYIGKKKTFNQVSSGVNSVTNTCIQESGSNYSSAGLGKLNIQKEGSVVFGGVTHKTININGKEWLAENLNYKFNGLVVGSSGSSSIEPRGNYYNNNEASYGQYGLLYNWAAVNYLEQNKSILIPGWRVPTINDINDLIANVGGYYHAGKFLKDESCRGLDWFSFSELMSGMYYSENSNDVFQHNGEYGTLWTSSERDINRAYYKYFYVNSDAIEESYYYSYDGAKSTQYPVRLVKDVV